MKREFLMLAHKHKKQNLMGYYLSEKLDGMRAFWDGGITRGLRKDKVGWANNDKDERYKETQYATGLWSRYGNVIHAPKWWLDELPKVPMDGELYLPGKRQELMKIVKSMSGTDWTGIQYKCFDLPAIEHFLDTTLSWNTFKHTLPYTLDYEPKNNTPFLSKLVLMVRHLPTDMIQPQFKVPDMKYVYEHLDDVVDQGGEGLMLRSPMSEWEPRRSHSLLKIKKNHDAEAMVIGYVTGRETDKGSKLLGKMGSLVCQWQGKIIKLSGFTYEERELEVVQGKNIPEMAMYASKHYKTNAAEAWSMENPECRTPDFIRAKHFPIGTLVTFKYRELTKDGMPEEARYWRQHVSV